MRAYGRVGQMRRAPCSMEDVIELRSPALASMREAHPLSSVISNCKVAALSLLTQRVR